MNGASSSPFSISLAGPDPVVPAPDLRLVEVLDRLLDRGAVVRAELWLTVADVDLVFLGADIVLASPDTINRHRVRPLRSREGACNG